MRSRSRIDVIAGRVVGGTAQLTDVSEEVGFRHTAVGTWEFTCPNDFRPISANGAAYGTGTTMFSFRVDITDRTVTIYSYGSTTGAGALVDADYFFQIFGHRP